MNELEHSVKKPIRKTILIFSSVFLLILCTVITFICYFTFSNVSYRNFNEKIEGAINYVESISDGDELASCIEKKEKSEKYLELQENLNLLVDDLRLEYLYIVIPYEDKMVNIISATSELERESGETDMPLLDESYEYPHKILLKYIDSMSVDDISYFEEDSGWGEFYTGVKPLKTSSGEVIGLICVDLSVELLHKRLATIIIVSALISILGIGTYATVVFLWFKKNVTDPIQSLENSTKAFAQLSHNENDINLLKYEAPNITTQNEIQSLSEAITLMSIDAKARIEEVSQTKRRANFMEEENERLQKEADAIRKINELSASVASLLANMPAMTFSKDVNTGRYLACNKLFSNYAGKDTPEEVVGLTDHEIFDAVTADHFVKDDQKAIEMNEAYIFYEDVVDAKGNPRQFQTTKLKFTDTTGRECLLGMCIDFTEFNKMKVEVESAKEAYEESKTDVITYSNIARALATDYTYLYYVNIKDDSFIEYHSNINENEMVVEKRGEDFFNQSHKEALEKLYKDDQDIFISSFTKDNIIKALDEHNTFTITYRLLVDNVPVYSNMKATRMGQDSDHLIIGVSNVDAQMKAQEAQERIKEEQTTYRRINALSGDYIAIYTVDPMTDHFFVYSSTASYEGLGLANEGSDFFNASRKDSSKNIYSEDIERFNKMFTKENVLREIEENSVFVLDYRLLFDGEPIYVSLKAAMIEEKDGPQLIVGVNNIDALVKREQEYDYKLSLERAKANVDALTGVKNKHAYVDVEGTLNGQIEENKTLEFAIVVFDVNGLKEVNDNLGHQAGDELLLNSSRIICDIFKHSPVFRIGGDEFCVIAQGEDYKEIDNLIKKMDNTNIENTRKKGIVIACGMAKYNHDRNVATVFQKADLNMYENKKFLKRIA